MGCGDPGASLCLLGAGNLNDVDLRSLRQHYAEIHLVDIDTGAVRSGLRRQGIAPSDTCRIHGPVDLTGVLDRLGSPGAPGPEPTADLLARLAGEEGPVPALRCDVTASTGVLTQLLQSVIDSGRAAEDVVRLSLALRDKHLADLVRLTRGGGTLLLVTDVVSTSTAPWLLRTSPTHLPDELCRLVQAHNFFTGTNPFRIVAVLEEDSAFRSRVAEVHLREPWLWPVTGDRLHLTCAISARRTQGSAGPGAQLDSTGGEGPR